MSVKPLSVLAALRRLRYVSAHESISCWSGWLLKGEIITSCVLVERAGELNEATEALP
jgi:hypothetical protein